MAGLKRVLVLAGVLSVVLAVVAGACYSEADRYAVEVVLNKPGVGYDASRLAELLGVDESWLGEALRKGVAYRSSYDPRLVVVVSLQPLEPGGKAEYLSVRVQAPLVYKAGGVEGGADLCGVGFKKPVRLAAGSGELEVSLGTLVVGAPSKVVFRPTLESVAPPYANLSVGGVVELRGTRSYSVAAPCFYVRGEQCYRVMVIIPGYDAPMDVEPGRYEVSMRLGWKSSADVDAVLVLGVEYRGLPANLSAAEGLGWLREPRGGVEALRKEVGGGSIYVVFDKSGCHASVAASGLGEDAVRREVDALLRALGYSYYDLELSAKGRVLEAAFELSGDPLREALRRELGLLVEAGAVKGLEAADVSAIVAAASTGLAGWNERLVWHDGRWIPYSRYPGAVIARCAEQAPEVFLSESESYEKLPVLNLREPGGGGAELWLLAALPLVAVLAAIAYFFRRKR
ncbi:hypothetical protein [Thermofilum pendens]|uniref:hypothetical protein n=1 Tax=Thermofilum pendens TaxID=2269 RepID=UPI0011E4ECEB|nr:hypothetical protein [Thermofilum pendens]